MHENKQWDHGTFGNAVKARAVPISSIIQPILPQLACSGNGYWNTNWLNCSTPFVEFTFQKNGKLQRQQGYVLGKLGLSIEIANN